MNLSFGGKNKKSKRGPSSAQKTFVESVRRNKHRIKNSDAEELWEKVSKAYMLFGVPRLFERKKKK